MLEGGYCTDQLGVHATIIMVLRNRLRDLQEGRATVAAGIIDSHRAAATESGGTGVLVRLLEPDPPIGD